MREYVWPLFRTLWSLCGNQTSGPLGPSQYPHRLERAPRVPGLCERVLPGVVHGPVEVERLEIHVRRDEPDERIQRVVGSAPTILSICAVLSLLPLTVCWLLPSQSLNTTDATISG